MNVYKNGKIRIQKGIVLERLNIRAITPFNKDPNQLSMFLGGKWKTLEYELKIILNLVSIKVVLFTT
jgi:hypothetical protein